MKFTEVQGCTIVELFCDFDPMSLEKFPHKILEK